MRMKRTLLMVVNDAAFFLSHRAAIALEARNAGFDVQIATMPGAAVEEIIQLGFVHHVLPLTRSGRNAFSELRVLFSLWRLLWKVRPTILHLVTIKPILYGGIAARLAPVHAVVAAVSGLGFVFVSRGRKAWILRNIAQFLYRLACGKGRMCVIFQNMDDRNAFIKRNILSEKKATIIRGSGVDLAAYSMRPEEAGMPIVCMAARLLKDKGVAEFVAAADILRQQGIVARFQLVGDVDPGNPSSFSEEEINRWHDMGKVELLGHRKDMPLLLSRAHIVVLPSYREGLPKVLIEAAACGRAVVTTDVPGCRDAIEENVTGILVPPRNAKAVAEAVRKLVLDPEMRMRMGRAGRLLAEREFAIEKIVSQHMDIYRSLEEMD